MPIVEVCNTKTETLHGTGPVSCFDFSVYEDNSAQATVNVGNNPVGIPVYLERTDQVRYFPKPNLFVLRCYYEPDELLHENALIAEVLEEKNRKPNIPN